MLAGYFLSGFICFSCEICQEHHWSDLEYSWKLMGGSCQTDGIAWRGPTHRVEMFYYVEGCYHAKPFKLLKSDVCFWVGGLAWVLFIIAE